MEKKIRKVYWYRTPDGRLLDESDDSAWRVHNQYVSRAMGYTYLGWSDGRHIKNASTHKKTGKNGFLKDNTKLEKTKIHDAIALELEDASKNMQRPEDRSKKLLESGTSGGSVSILPTNHPLFQMMR